MGESAQSAAWESHEEMVFRATSKLMRRLVGDFYDSAAAAGSPLRHRLETDGALAIQLQYAAVRLVGQINCRCATAGRRTCRGSNSRQGSAVVVVGGSIAGTRVRPTPRLPLPAVPAAGGTRLPAAPPPAAPADSSWPASLQTTPPTSTAMPSSPSTSAARPRPFAWTGSNTGGSGPRSWRRGRCPQLPICYRVGSSTLKIYLSGTNPHPIANWAVWKIAARTAITASIDGICGGGPWSMRWPPTD